MNLIEMRITCAISHGVSDKILFDSSREQIAHGSECIDGNIFGSMRGTFLIHRGFLSVINSV